MKVSFAGTTLADDATLLWCSGDSLLASRESEAFDLPGSAYGRVQDLGNASVEYGFEVAREHASLKAAQVFFLTHGQAVTGQGDAQLEPEGVFSLRFVRDAILTARGVSLRGLSSVFEYTILGAAVSGLVTASLVNVSVVRSPSLSEQASDSLAAVHVANVSTVYAPALAEQAADAIAGAHVANASTLYAPAASAQSSDTLAAQHVANASVVYAPDLVESIPGQHVANTGVLYAPPALTVQSSDSMAGPNHVNVSTLYAPTIAEFPPANLIRGYKFEDLTEELGNADLVVEGSPTVATGKDGNCFSYVLANDRHVTDWYATGNFSISAWLKTTTRTNNFFGSHDNANHRAYFGFDSTSTVRMGVGTAYDDFSYSTTSGAWHHFVITFDGATARIYVDGVQRGSIGASFSGASSTPFPEGVGGGNYYFNGQADELYIFDRAITLEEVETLYNGGAGTFLP